MEWLKKNIAVTLGIGLPLLLVLFFALATTLPKLFTDPPAYDVLFLTGYSHHGTHGLKVEVSDGKPRFTFHGNRPHSSWPKLYRYSPKENRLTEITITMPDSLRTLPQAAMLSPGLTTPVPVPELEALKLDASEIAPDGYHFGNEKQYRTGLFSGLFYSSRHARTPSLSKNGYLVRIPPASDSQYLYNYKFVGWVIP